MAGGQSGQWREVHPSRSHRPETGSRPRYEVGRLGENRLVTRAVEELNRRMLRSRDAIDRTYAYPLDVRALAGVASVSEAHYIRTFKATFGETPHRYLQRRRVERAMFMLRETDRAITDVCFDVGFMSVGTFSRTFREIVGETPSDYREGHAPIWAPNCMQMAFTRPRIAAS